MKKKIRCINIDGFDGYVKTYVLREISKYLKNKDLEFFTLKDTSDKLLSDQFDLLKNNPNHLILKENSLISLYRDEIVKGNGVNYLKQKYSGVLVEEQKINHSYGGVYILLLPEKVEDLKNILSEELSSVHVADCHYFFKNIKNYNVAEYLDIRTVWYNENDKIFDIKDKIVDILEKEYY